MHSPYQEAMRLILVLGLICKASFIYCRSVQIEENPGQKLAQFLIPLLDDALDPSGDDASLLEVHPYNDGTGGRRKVELTPLNAKTKKEAKPLAIILTSNLADLKKKKERKLRTAVSTKVPSDETGDASKELRTRSKNNPARGSLSKNSVSVYMNNIRNKPRNQSRKKIEVPNYEIKNNKKSHYDEIVEDKNEVISDEKDLEKQTNFNKSRKDAINRSDKTMMKDVTSQEETIEEHTEESDSSILQSTRAISEFEDDSTREFSMEKFISDVTDSINSEGTEEKQIHKNNKHPITEQKNSDEGIDRSNHIQKKSNAELSNEIIWEQVTKSKEVNSHETVEQVSSKTAKDYLVSESLEGGVVVKKVDSEEDHNEEDKSNETKELNETEENYHTSEDTLELINEKDSSQSERRGVVLSENVAENKPMTGEVSKSIEKSEISIENQSKHLVHELLTAEETHEFASQMYDIYNSDVTTKEEQLSDYKYSGESKAESSEKIKHEQSLSKEVITNKKVPSSETSEAELKNNWEIKEKYSDTEKTASSKASDEKSENKISRGEKEVLSISEERPEKIEQSNHNSRHINTVESGVNSSEESTKRSKNVNIMPNNNELSAEIPKVAKNCAKSKSIDDVYKKHWVRHRGKPEHEALKAAKKEIHKKSSTRRNANVTWEHNHSQSLEISDRRKAQSSSSEQEQSYSSTSEYEKEKSDLSKDHTSSQDHNNSYVLEHHKEYSDARVSDHLSSEHHQEKSLIRRSDPSSSEHEVLYRSHRYPKEHRDKLKISSQRNNNEDKDVESDTKYVNSDQNANIYKSYNLSFKFEKK